MKSLNKWLLISFVIGTMYGIYSLVYWGGAISGEGNEGLSGTLALTMVMPHLVCTLVAIVFNGLGLFLKKQWFAVVGAILYTVAMILFPMYFMFVIIQMILSYIGFAQLHKQSKTMSTE